MEKKMIINYKNRFDEIRHEENGVEFWYARELMHLLGYSRWQNFENVLSKAEVACANNGITVENHFAEASKIVTLGSGANREVEDYMLTRYACYLIAENGDSRKEQIAFAQSYFAVQTRKQELIEERISYIERTEARGRLRDSEQDKRPLADFLPTLTIAAKNLATEMTNYNVEEKDLQGENAITVEHVENNTSVREMLEQRGIKPENLPASEDIKKLERRVKREEKKLAEQSGKLTNE